MRLEPRKKLCDEENRLLGISSYIFMDKYIKTQASDSESVQASREGLADPDGSLPSVVHITKNCLLSRNDVI